MFSSKFLSGANPLNAVSSAVNKFGLFGDEGEGNKKPPPQQGVKPAGEQQPGVSPGKDPQQNQGPPKAGQGTPMQKSQPVPKQGSPQLQGNGQTGPSNKPAGQQAASRPGTQPAAQLKGEPPKNQPKGPQQQGSPKPEAKQQAPSKSGAQPESPKASSQQQVPPKTKMQQQGPAKTGAQQQQPAKTGVQGSTKVGTELGQQQQGSPKPGQQKGGRTTPQQQGTKGPGTPGSSSPAANRSQSKAGAKSLCPVCNTTELNVHTKDPPNYKNCTQCKTEVCSLCGFSPPDSDGREWLCLTCQIKRAQGTSEPPGPPMKKPTSNQTPSPAAPVKKETSAPGSPQRLQSTSTKVPAKGEAAKGPESQKQASPATAQKTTPETQKALGSPKPSSQPGRKQSSASPAPQQESGGLFGFGGAKTEAAKPEESVTGKMFGFGSSIFSSASTLIASAVQDEPKTTPPVSPKMQPAKETKPTSAPKSEQDKKQQQPQQAKAQPAGQGKVEKSETPKVAAAPQGAPKADKSTCPICKMVLNMGSKDAPNYNSCTDCKSIVCNQCGFNPMPNVKEGNEWLCLNCQVKRAAAGIEPQRDPSLVNSFKKTPPAQLAPQKTSSPGSPQKKVSTPAAQPAKAEAPDGHKQVSPAPGQTKPQESQKTGPQQSVQKIQTAQKQGNATAPPQQESGGFFGFGGGKTQPEAAKPAESVTGKMFGFGSSIFSSASTLITSAVQDESKITPPVSPKMSPAKDPKSQTVKKQEQEKKPEQPQQAKGSPSVQPKADKPPSEPLKKASASPVVSKAGQSTCPLCKLELNVGSKDPPNYNTCTECKNTVCNQCGFNPMPNVKEVKEWLCLNCQMQRALGASEPPGTPMMKLQASPNKVSAPTSAAKKDTPPLDTPQKKDIPAPAESKIKEGSPSGSPVRKPQKQAEQIAKTEAVKGPESQKQVSPAPGQKTPQQGQKTGPQKPPDQAKPNQTGVKKSSITSTTQEESGGFFGFGGPKPQPDAAKPAESIGGKMFGFGSSIFSSASTLINSAVQDESKTTPPVSPKMPAANKSPPVQKPEQEKKPEQVQQPKTSPLPQAKVEKGPSELKKDAAASPAVPKAGQSTCPLCKVQLNFGSKEPPNYNKCTECQNTVCNQCGFNPMPNVSEVKEWLCLNCQMQRALSASELTGPPMKPNTGTNKIAPSAVQQKITAPNQVEKKGSSTPGSPQKTPPAAAPPAAATPAAATPAAKVAPAAKGPESETKTSPAPGRKTPVDIPGAPGSQKPTDQTRQSALKPTKAATDTQQESGKTSGLTGPKAGPDASKTTESVSGKMFGFGSSIFSSASNLISSAVQEESRTTPPGSRKMSAPAQVSPKMSAVPKISPKSTPTVSPKMSPKKLAQKPEQEKKLDESKQVKEDKAPAPSTKAATVSQTAPDAGQTTCPLCKVELNIGSKQPPNYNTCTECKAVVCNQCGFNPMPIGEVKEWLCLNCQMKRAVGAAESLGPPTLKPQTSPKKVPSPAAVQLKDSPKPTSPQKKATPDLAVQKKETSEPVSPQRKQSTASVRSGKSEPAPAPLKQASPAPDRKIPQEKQKPAPEKLPDQASQAGRKQSNASTGSQQESGGFFGFGGPKPQPEAVKPAESVTGKMFGFGSSIFSSASTLITSAVQDQPKTTPPVSPKMSPAKDPKSPAVKKPEEDKKPEQPQQTKGPTSAQPKAGEIKSPALQKSEQQKKAEPSQPTKTPPPVQAKVDKAPSEPPKPSAVSQEAVKPDQSTCPLCKVKLNIGSKDLPNYSTCTECKNAVCNQCGFNPMPNETGAKEWLCLTCQMQRALGAAQPPEVASVNAQTPAKPQKKDISSPAEPEKKQSSAPQSPQRKLSVKAQPPKSDTTDKPEVQKKASPVPSKKIPLEPQKTTGPSKSPEQPRQAERKQSNATAATQKESGGFFGFGGGKAQPEAEKPAESVTGKMFGFGSSIFSSASTLITSTVQDQPKTTPPVSPKLCPAKEIKSPAAQEKKKPEQPQQTKASPQVQAKVEKAPSEPPKAAGVTVKPGQSSCPLCKAELNVGSKDPPNYNMCTECKNTVCNQCGFNTMPNELETKEWLCLTCQMQRALKATESVQPPLMKPQASPSKVPAPAQKDATAQKAEVPDKTQKDSPAPGAPQKKTDITQQLITATPPAKDTPAPASASTKEEKPSEPPAKEVPASTAPPSKETGTKVSDPSAPLPAQAPPFVTDMETSIEKKKDLTQPNVSQTKAVPEKTEEKAETVQKTAVKSSDEVQPQQAKEPQLVETSLAKTAPPATQPEKQESGSFFSFGSPKSQRSASITTEAVTGKMMGFGSSIFSSASNLITSAVQDESRTPPSSRKMSAPPVSDRKSELQVSPKPSPPSSPKVTTAKEVKPQTAQKPEAEKIPAQPQEVKAAPSGLTKVDKASVEPAKTEASQAAAKVGQSTCPLCKVELNMDSKNPPNYNTCTECKTTVCSKCGFSPMPSVTEAKEWLCLNCQMQRALGASEPPGLPMIKPQPSPSKEVPVTTEKKETPASAPQEDIPKPSAPKTALAEIATAKETDATEVSAPTKKVTPAAAPLPDKSIPSTITKTDVSPAPQKPSADKPKQAGAPQQQTPKVQTTSKPAAPQPDTGKPPTQQPPKAGTSPAKSAPPPAQPAKQESGGFFGFGAPKTPPTAAKSAESVTGKMFGFGSSFLSSASTLITSAVQDESKTPPTPRKMSTASVSPKTTPPASPKTVLPKDTKPPAVQKTEEKKPEKPQQDKTPPTVQAKVDKAPSELHKAPTDTQGASKADQSTCPLCKVKLNMGSKDLPNYNTCTECKTTVCNQCGFNPMPNVSEVKEWLCLNCQMQRALGASEPTGPAVVKPQPSPGKVSAPQKEIPVLVQKEKPTEHTEVQKEATETTLPKKETPKAEAAVPTAVQKTDKPQQDIVQKTQEISGTQQRQALDKAGQQILVGKPPQATKPEVKPEAGKLPQQPPKSATPPAKSAPPPAQPTKQESGGFFGFGAPKTPPIAVKSAESVTGKMFGFGSSFLSSASTLITSAVQDESKTTPPTPRKMSMTTTPKTTPPVSPKMAAAKDTKPPATQKSEPPQQAKPIPAAQVKAEKAPPEPPRPTEVTKVAPKASLSTCPLCKVELNVGSKDPPNYNTCTECQNTVCNLCGFNPMPHTGAKEWLCLNCQTQRALSGQLGDSGKMSQPSPVPAKAETQATPAAKKAEPKTALIKAEEKPGATKPQPVPAPIEAVPTVPTTKAKTEPTSVKMEAMATAASVQIELETTKTPKIAKVSPVIAEKQPLAASTAEPYMPPMAPVQHAEVTPKVEVPNTDIPKTVTVENKKETMKTDISVTEPPKAQESKPDLPEVKVEASVVTTSATPMITATAVPTETIEAEAPSVVVPETETKAQVSVPERSIKEVQLDEDIKLTKPAKSLQQIEAHPTTQEQQLSLEVQPVKEAESKEIADKLDEKITDITSAPESQPVPKKSIIIKAQDENKEDLEKKRKVSLPTGQVQLENKVVPVTTIKPASKEEHEEDQPQIFPVVQELSDEQAVSDASKNDINTDLSIPVKEEVKAERRRLSFQAMDDSSESELTPSPSPKVQRRRLKVSPVSSSSEDIKTESADSSVEDEEFIRKQIMGMGDEEEMSVSEEEKEKISANIQAVKEVELDDTSVTAKSLPRKGSKDNEDSPARKKSLPKADTETAENVPETMPRTAFKKATPAMRQRQSTDEEVESITESLSKGSSSVQASSFTPGSSPTSASSLEEDSDSSPIHKKVSGDKHHRKGKHRQPTQPLPTIEDSSEEEQMRAHGQPLSPPGDASSTEDLRQVTIIDESHRTSGSEYSASIESEPEVKRAVQRGRKPSPTVIPYNPDPFEEKQTVTKSLKSAEEAYEEIIQKTKAIPGESPPDIEPLYGGMAIEDYLYESLVEEPEIKMSESQEEEPKLDNGSESLKKLRSPEEVYEEMMQKKRELMMIEHEFQQAQTAMESSSSGASVTGSIAETCVVTIPTEETYFTGQTDIPPADTDSLSEVPMKKKKRPAPPRPSEPPKRPEVTVHPSTPSGSIGFVRPMVPLDPALRKALFPIPDLKITQCSSGEEEDDSLADEYGIGISSDITPSDDSEAKDDQSISPPLSESTEMEPISVICEIPEPKPIPTPISAPELTTTPSPVSPMSPPTSPATPDSSLASNATSSSSFQAQTPISSDSTPLSTPTPPTSFKGQSPPEIPLPATIAAVPSAASSTSTTVIVTIPDVVSHPSKGQTTVVVQDNISTAGAPSPALAEMSTAVPVVVQMPDLVSSPSQVPIKFPAVQVAAPSPALVISTPPIAQVTAPVVSVSALTSTNAIPTSVALASCPEPLIVQMLDLVSTTAPISEQTPVPVSALITTPAQAQAKVVHSVPVQSALPSMSPIVVPAPAQTAQVLPPAPASTTVVKKKVPPPPPPRSTSVSLSDSNTEQPSAKNVQQVTPTTLAMRTTVASQPMQSVVVDIQPRMDIIPPNSVSVPQVVTSNRQGHVVIIVPSVEKMSLSGQNTQDITGTAPTASTASPPHSNQEATRPASDIPSTDISSLSTKMTAVQVASAPPLPPKPIAGTNTVHTVEVTGDSTPPSPKLTAYPKPPVATAVTIGTSTIAPVSVTTTGPSQITKPPPPIPPKPISIPAGLVFSHKPGESVKPPPPPVAPKAATLPRTKEPPSALSLSLTRPAESKLGTTSPKSPLSPRHAKCLQTYVVITLPSEPGSPTEAITVQAPVRRGSIPSTKVSGVRTTPSEQKTPTEAFSAQAAVRRASVPTVRHPPPMPVSPVGVVEKTTTSEVMVAKVQAKKEAVPSVVQVPVSVTDTIAIVVSTDQDTSIQAQTVPPPIKKPYVQPQQSMTQPLQPLKTMTEVITVPAEPKVLIQPVTVQDMAREQSTPFVPQHPSIATVVITHPPEGLPEAVVPQLPQITAPVQPEPLTEVVAVPVQPGVPLDALVNQDRSAAPQSTVLYPEDATQIEMLQDEQDIPTDVIVTEAFPKRQLIPEVSQQIAIEQPLTIYESVTHSQEQEFPPSFYNTETISELSSVPQTVQLYEVPPIVTEQLSTQQPALVTEVMTLPSKFELPTEVITTDTVVRIPEVATVSPLPHTFPIVAEVAQISEVAELMPLTTDAKIIIPPTAQVTPGPLVMEVEQMATHPDIHPVPCYTPQVYEAINPFVMSHSVPPLEVIALQPGHETPTEIITKDVDVRRPSVLTSAIQPQTVAGMPVITTEETTHRRRTSISSIVQPPYTTTEIFAYPAEYDISKQVVTTEAFAATRRESITMQQSLPLAQAANVPTEKVVPIDGYPAQAPYRRESIPSAEQHPQVLTYSSEYDHPLETITTRRTSMPTVQDIPQGIFEAPVTITKIQQESIESQEIRGPEKVVSSMSHMYSSSISTSGQPPESLPSLVTQVVTTEVQRTTVSVVHERLPQVPPPSVAITIQPDIAKVQPVPKQNGKIIYPGDVIDLRTMKVGIKMTDQGMDLTPPESCRQSFSSDSIGRQITAVQPEIVNLSAEITPATTLSVVTDSITIVTCTATIASYNNTPAEKPLDLQGPVMSLPLPLTTYKPFEPLAQIVYRPVNSQPKLSAVASTAQDIPINLSLEALVSSGGKQPMTTAPTVISNGGPVLSLEATGAMDLSNYRPVRAMVALSGTSPGVVTTVVEDDGTPVDLTAGRRSVCCDVIYKLPFTGSCRTQPPVTSQPDNRFGYRDDHYQYENAGMYGIKGMNGIKASMSETNLTEAGLFPYDPKNDYDYLSGSSDGAIDLTAAKISAGKALDYTSKAAGLYPAMTTAPFSQVPAAGFGVNSVLRTSDGIVYSSVAAPVPSTYAITTQPGSVFSTTLTPTSLIQNQSVPHPYGFIPTTDPGQIIPFDTDLSKELLPTALADIITGYPDMYSDTTLEAIAASLDALASSPIFPGLDNTKMAQYQMEREFLELEKLKQLCLAEELEWERQEIQRYREQEQLMVQRELEELQALKQQLLLQQEEEHHAHMVAQQETYAQQKEQLQQIQQLQLQLQRQLDDHYGTTGTTGNLLDAKYAGVGDSGQYWPVKDESTVPSVGTHIEEDQNQRNLLNKLQADQDTGKKIIDSGVQTDDEDSAEKQHVGRRKKNKRNIDSSAQTDDEDQDEWDAPTKARRRSRKHSSDGKHGSKVSSIAIQTVAEISVQTDHSGTIKRPNVQMDTKVEIIKHISAPENSQRGGSLSCQTDSDRRHTPIELGYSTHLTADVPSKSKVFYSQVSPMSPEKSLGGQRMLTADPNRFSSGPRILKAGQKSLSDPKSLSPSTDDRMGGYYADSYSGRGSTSSTGKKVKRTLPDPPPEDDSLTGRSGYSTNSARRRLARSTTMARAKILQDIDKELDLVERESSKLRKKQAELDEEEKEIDAKLRYLEMGINRRKEALLKEREKRERAYLQGVAEERDYMSDSEVSNIREARGDGLERPRTAPQSEFDQFIPPQTEADSQYNTLTSPYSHYAQYVPQTQTTSHYTQQNLYQQQSLYHQQVSPYPTLSLSHAQGQPSSYQHALLLQQGKQRQTTLSDLEPKITTNYEVIRNQPLLIVPSSTESGYGVAHLGGKYGNLDLRLGLEERSMASSPMSSISADSFYADIDHHNARNYVLIEDIGELTKTSTGLSNTGLGSGFNLPDKELSKADRLLRAAEVRRTAEVAEFLGSSRLQGYGKGEDDTMEEPYELKLLKQQIKQEFRRGTEGLEHLTGLGLPQYLPSDGSFRHFPKGEKYSIGRLTLEKQAAKQLPAAMLYQKQMKNKKALIDPKAITKFSPIQESRDLEPEFGSYMGSGASSVSSLAARARLLQDEITFGLRKNLSEQQKYLGSSLGANLSGSLNLGQSLGLGSTIRATVQDDGTYPSGTRSRPPSRPSSRPSSVYGLDLSIKRDLSSSSLRLKTEGEVLDAAFAPGVARAKPTSLPISQSRGRIPIVAQNSEEESPLSPVGQPMGMARASAGPLPPISADSRDQFGSSHSLPEVQQHMREESRTRGYDRDIAFIMDDLQGAMSDSEAGGPNWNIEAYHLRREDTDWFDKPREGHPQSGSMSDRRQMKLVPYAFPHTRIKLKRDLKDTSVSGNGLGIRVVGGKEIPGSRGEIGAYIAKVIPGGAAEQTGKVVEGMQVLEWNGVPLMGKTYEEVQCIMGQPCAEAELCVRLDLNMLSDPEHPQALEHHVQLKAGGQRSPGVDPKQLAAELQKVSQQQAPGLAGAGVGPGGLGVLSALERSALLHSGTGSAASSGVPSPGQPASPAINKKQRHKPAEMMRVPHPITGEIQLQINYDRNLGNLIVHVLQARNLAPRDNDGYSDPFVKVYLLPGRGADNKRRTKYAQKTMNPEWNQTVIYKNIHLEQLKKKTLEVTVWDYDRSSSNDFLGEVLIDLSNTAQLDNTPRWLPLKEQSESIEHSRAHHAAQGPPGSGSGLGHGPGQGHMPGPGQGHGMGLGQAPGQDLSHDSPKNSVIKSRSHGIFPDPAKDMQMMPLEKSHSSPGSSKSSSDGQLRSHGPSRSQSKSSVTQAHLEDAGIAIAAAEAAVQQSRLQPRPGHRLGDVSGSVVLSAPSLVGDAYGGLDGEEGADTGVDSAIFQVPRIGKTIPNGTDKTQLGTAENEGGKTQVMGEIKVALKKEVKTEGDQLVLEILQCRNITYKFKSPDHLPDLYVKLYVVNVATQKRIIKKKTRVCRHDREPSFNETFRFPLNPTGHSIQLFLVSNGGKFMKKTLIGEAYIWLDKVDMRKRVVSWHKLFVSSTQTNP